MKGRDSQRAKVYAAEKVLDSHTTHVFTNLAQVRRRIEAILSSKWVSSRFIVRSSEVFVRTSRRLGRASYHGRGVFTLPIWAWRDSVVLHELAHMLESKRVEDFAKMNAAYSWGVRIDAKEHASHGWRFCSTYLELVRRFMTRAASKDLRASFEEHGVRYRDGPA